MMRQKVKCRRAWEFAYLEQLMHLDTLFTVLQLNKKLLLYMAFGQIYKMTLELRKTP